MSEIILTQAYDILVMSAAGMTVMIFYDLLEWYQKRKTQAKGVTFVQDILFWIFAALLTSSFLYYCAYGLVSFHAMGAFCIGGLLWKICFTPKISRAIKKICDIIKRTISLQAKTPKGQTYEKKEEKPRF